MSNDALQPVANDQLRVSVEMGQDYAASERVAGALAELSAALLEAEAENSDDVAGFGLVFENVTIFARPFVYDSKEPDSFCSTVGNKQEPYLKIKF